MPLSPQAVSLLKTLYTHRSSSNVFLSLSNGAMPKVLRRLAPNATVHGFRSSFSDWAHERTSYANHVIEMSLAHKISNATEAAYRRGDLLDKRRKLMEAWGTYCASPPAGEVIPLRAATS